MLSAQCHPHDAIIMKKVKFSGVQFLLLACCNENATIERRVEMHLGQSELLMPGQFVRALEALAGMA